VRVTRNASGTVKRLNAAVVVNNRSSTDPKGKTTQVPLSDPEIEKLTSLVRESIGFSKDRGDSVKVINAPFKIEVLPQVDTPLWKQPELLDMLRAAAVPTGLVVVALLVFFGMIRPALNAALVVPPPPEPGSTVSEVVDDPQHLPALPAPKTNEHLDGARALAKDNPAAVAGIVRGWVNGEAALAKT
jgi:flagellar M-ring protein FliF